MNANLLRAELERLKVRQERLVAESRQLGVWLEQLEQRVATSEQEVIAPVPQPLAPEAAALPTPAAPVPEIVLPPILEPRPPTPIFPTSDSLPRTTEDIPPGPPPPMPSLHLRPRPVVRIVEEPTPLPTPAASDEPEATPPGFPPEPPPMRVAPPQPASLEMRVGSYWLPRLGIVIILTALGFFAAYAYQNFVPKLGLGGKVFALYAVSGLLLGLGAWLQRRRDGEEAMRNYGQVLLAGGLAAVYFTTFAAHHIEALRVIPSALVDGLLLLGWAGFIVWIAERKQSELLAMFAVGLAYYTSIITHVGAFTLYSNLLLAVAAVVFLIRNRWAMLSAGSLVATYAVYAFWRFHPDGAWRWAQPDERLGFSALFLAAYWLVFTVATFLSQHEDFVREKRATFLTLNNAAAFGLFLLTMWQVQSGGFWKVALGYGSALIVCAALAERFLTRDPLAAQTYLTQGLLLVTVGFITKFTGPQLALVLALESVTLLMVGLFRQNRVLEAGAYVAGLLAMLWCLDGLDGSSSALWLAIGIGAQLQFNAFWVGWRGSPWEAAERNLKPAIFTALALITWLAGTCNYFHGTTLALVLAGESTLFLVLAPWRQNFTLNAGAYVAAALAVWHFLPVLDPPTPAQPWTGIVLGLLLAGNAFWTHLKSPSAEAEVVRLRPAYFSALAVAVWFVATHRFVPAAQLPVWFAAEAVVLTASVHWLRLRELALIGQALLVFGLGFWLSAFSGNLLPPGWVTAGLLAGTLAHVHWWQWQPAIPTPQPTRLGLSGLLAGVFVTILNLWLRPEFTPVNWLAVAGGLAVVLTAYAWATRSAVLAVTVQAFVVSAVVYFIEQMLRHPASGLAALAPIGALGVLSGAGVVWSRAGTDPEAPSREWASQFARVYRWLALALSLWWVTEFVPSREQMWALTLAGVAGFAWAGWRRNGEALLFGAVFTAAGLLRFVLTAPAAESVYLPNLLALLALLAQQRIARRLPDRFDLGSPAAHHAVIVAGGLGLWLLLSRWVTQSTGGFYLTASWSGLALAFFAGGIFLRERIYRWFGLAVLAAALGRVVVFDVWKLEALYRILSFIALGIVLLLLGYLYNRNPDKVRQWL